MADGSVTPCSMAAPLRETADGDGGGGGGSHRGGAGYVEGRGEAKKAAALGTRCVEEGEAASRGRRRWEGEVAVVQGEGEEEVADEARRASGHTGERGRARGAAWGLRQDGGRSWGLVHKSTGLSSRCKIRRLSKSQTLTKF